MVPRNRPTDPLLPLPQPTWLVFRTKPSQALEWRRLRPGADLQAILSHERDQRTAEGWARDEIGRVCSDFFATRPGRADPDRGAAL